MLSTSRLTRLWLGFIAILIGLTVSAAPVGAQQSQTSGEGGFDAAIYAYDEPSRNALTVVDVDDSGVIAVASALVAPRGSSSPLREFVDRVAPRALAGNVARLGDHLPRQPGVR